ncbi:MAG: 2-amino-4-hydroxy-6-hydroxymethyldihydropteridine diphosphokinase [Rhodanobacter sp.]
MAQSWLLLLGSNQDSDASVRAALARLAAHGAVDLLTPIRRFGSDDGAGGQYYNALAQWRHADDGTPMLTCIRQIELELGRDRGSAEVAIDIDVLAAWIGQRWHAHAHAAEKNEFTRASVLTLLHEAGLEVMQTPRGKG